MDTMIFNRTQKEMGKEYVIKTEVYADINKMLDQLNRLENKIDRLMEKE